ncbi:hypothetical protein B0H16DRAFT_1694053 [Mycena metata]|uniref:Uncharacterized protein n=1 Tax=Mycena metata TaxID=1033252 RepID=A0AAD7IEM1_9AGAR|nr:hypothetical protein B0H16DRAFT_1694053 [Mycena metata]
MLSAALLLLAHNCGLRDIHLICMTATGWKQSSDYNVITTENIEALKAKEFGFRAAGEHIRSQFEESAPRFRPQMAGAPGVEVMTATILLFEREDRQPRRSTGIHRIRKVLTDGNEKWGNLNASAYILAP